MARNSGATTSISISPALFTQKIKKHFKGGGKTGKIRENK
jgi:hypothetical protein